MSKIDVNNKECEKNREKIQNENKYLEEKRANLRSILLKSVDDLDYDDFKNVMCEVKSAMNKLCEIKNKRCNDKNNSIGSFETALENFNAVLSKQGELARILLLPDR